MIFLTLLFTFFKIGLFSFGGGYAMIPLIEKEIESHGWLSASEFIDIIAIAEMTPGPIAVNSATFVGYKTAGFFGGLSATFGVSLPSLLIILLVSQFFFKYRKHSINNAIFYGVRPVIAGLILSASIFVAETSLFKQDSITNLSTDFFNDFISNVVQAVNISGLLILAVTLFLLIKLKVHPVLSIVIAGALGILLNYTLPVLGVSLT